MHAKKIKSKDRQIQAKANKEQQPNKQNEDKRCKQTRETNIDK